MFCASVCAAAQGVVSYEVDPVSRDSFFLTETITGAATQTAPRPQIAVTSVLYKSLDDLLKFVSDLRRDADKQDEEAEAAKKQAAKKREMADKIDLAAKKHIAFFARKQGAKSGQ